jgi:hypothetical protein
LSGCKQLFQSDRQLPNADAGCVIDRADAALARLWVLDQQQVDIALGALNLRQGIAGGFGGLNHVVEVCFPPFEKSLENMHE